LRTGKRVALALVAMWLLATPILAAPVTPKTARRVCEALLSSMVKARGGWAGSRSPGIAATEPVLLGDTLIAYRFTVRPSGYVLINARRELAPLAGFSQRGGKKDDPGYLTIVSILAARHRELWRAMRVRSLVESPGWKDTASLQNNEHLQNPGGGTGSIALMMMDPLTTTVWTQDYPFLALCPYGDGHRGYVGCNGLALAQLMRYWQWPPRGLGPYSYWWDGDQSCGGTTAGATVSSDFDTDYDWDQMPDLVSWDSPLEQIQAVARLCLDAAVAINTDFGACGSSAQFSRISQALPQRFFYGDQVQFLWRFRYTTEQWFDKIEEDIEQGRPIPYSTVIHTFLVDGCFQWGTNYLVHANFGWGGEDNGWFLLDVIYTSVNPQAEQAVFGVEPDRKAYAKAMLKQGRASHAVPGAAADVLLPASPNPANPRTVLRYRLSRAGGVVLSVYDLLGRRLRVLVDGDRAAGEHTVAWDGTDAAGRPAATGIYRVRLRTPGGDHSETISLVR